MNKKTIIPIASGKGGVGKTFLAANLSESLAAKGKKVIAVDLDLGASNLHTSLGLSAKNSGVGDFLKKNLHSLNDLIIPTATPNLKLITGDNSMPFMANISPVQKNRLIKSICSLPADYIILDLGAGSSFQTLNFFTISRNGIMVTTTDPTSVLNFLTFLKNLFFKIITSMVKENRIIYHEVIEEIRSSGADKKITVDLLISKIRRYDPLLAANIKQIISSFKPSLVLNMGDSVDDLLEFEKIAAIIKKTFSIDVNFAGYIAYDQDIRKANRLRKSLRLYNPDHEALQSIERISTRILRGFNKDLFELIDAEKKDHSLFKAGQN